ncbi:hypothetical protein BKA63DRAFT_591112 [Paraphoma chrysanthemicola]|nr:hypothetical protein BKA63DRAFT_591112 [Paraphoma chrysanthemicola]
MVASSNRDLHGPSVDRFKSRRRTRGPAAPVAAGCACVSWTVDGRARRRRIIKQRLCPLEAATSHTALGARVEPSSAARGMHARPCRLTTTAQPSNSDSTPDELVGNSASGIPSPFPTEPRSCPVERSSVRTAPPVASLTQPRSGMHRFHPALLRAAREVIHHSALWLPHPPDCATRYSETLLVFGVLRLERPVAARLSCVTFLEMQPGPIGPCDDSAKFSWSRDPPHAAARPDCFLTSDVRSRDEHATARSRFALLVLTTRATLQSHPGCCVTVQASHSHCAQTKPS